MAVTEETQLIVMEIILGICIEQHGKTELECRTGVLRDNRHLRSSCARLTCEYGVRVYPVTIQKVKGKCTEQGEGVKKWKK